MARELLPYQLVERSIIKKYRKEIWNPFIESAKDYSLICDGDTILVNMDGSANAVLIAKLLQHLKRISDTEFDIVFQSDDNYSELNIPTVPKAEGYNKIASTECFDDVIELTLDSILNDSRITSILPQKDGVIRPLFCIKRDYIKAFARYNSLDYKAIDSDKPATSELINQLDTTNPGIAHSIFKSVHSVCLDTMLGYESGGEHHSYLEKY